MHNEPKNAAKSRIFVHIEPKNAAEPKNAVNFQDVCA